MTWFTALVIVFLALVLAGLVLGGRRRSGPSPLERDHGAGLYRGGTGNDPLERRQAAEKQEKRTGRTRGSPAGPLLG
ncbi:hypothetical protein [Nocardioides sp. J54]|uniref:hypothetical protein n=1 Tax=Nocardioides sp. J54 TaxID=935866 RepID=UPI00048B2ABE|nr:hypothetical protein [Nocardioides sp. J54]